MSTRKPAPGDVDAWAKEILALAPKQKIVDGAQAEIDEEIEAINVRHNAAALARDNVKAVAIGYVECRRGDALAIAPAHPSGRRSLREAKCILAVIAGHVDPTRGGGIPLPDVVREALSKRDAQRAD